ncbi:hypothetical protein EF405_05130 [Cyclobacteriaceae bacterium YHN15]|jgi:hypothetical protein|nr:hypothetical protein EF405_05130 [Cyclobacteriaceae bacterium YHN15]
MLKNYIFKSFGFILTFFFFFACSSKIEVKGVDLDNWKKDRNGCIGLRFQDLENFKTVKNDLLGKDNQALIKTFGRPDKVELANRSQTFFIYFIEPGPDCETEEKPEEPLKVIFRLNAISRVSEVTISTLDP